MCAPTLVVEGNQRKTSDAALVVAFGFSLTFVLEPFDCHLLSSFCRQVNAAFAFGIFGVEVGSGVDEELEEVHVAAELDGVVERRPADLAARV